MDLDLLNAIFTVNIVEERNTKTRRTYDIKVSGFLPMLNFIVYFIFLNLNCHLFTANQYFRYICVCVSNILSYPWNIELRFCITNIFMKYSGIIRYNRQFQPIHVVQELRT